MGKEIWIYCRLNVYKRLIFNKWVQAIRTCGYSDLSCGKSTHGNFELVCITILLWVIKYIFLIIAFKAFLWTKWARMEKRYVLFFLHCKISKWICCWKKQKREHFNLWSFILFYILWQNYISPFLVEIVKYLESFFKLFSHSEKELGNLEKYCNYFTETVFHILRASSSNYPSVSYYVFLL